MADAKSSERFSFYRNKNGNDLLIKLIKKKNTKQETEKKNSFIDKIIDEVSKVNFKLYFDELKNHHSKKKTKQNKTKRQITVNSKKN